MTVNNLSSSLPSLPIFVGTYRPLKTLFLRYSKTIKTLRCFYFFRNFNNHHLLLRYVVTRESHFQEWSIFFTWKIIIFLNFWIWRVCLRNLPKKKPLKKFVVSFFSTFRASIFVSNVVGYTKIIVLLMIEFSLSLK